MGRTFLILNLSLLVLRCSAQDDRYDFGEVIEVMVADPSIGSLLFSYDYHGDHPLFIAYTDEIRGQLKGSKYQDVPDWEYGLDFNFEGKRVYLREHGFLFSERVGYYLQIDSISVKDDRALLRIRTNTMSGKLKELKYFVGEVRLVRANGAWLLDEKKLTEKDPNDKW